MSAHAGSLGKKKEVTPVIVSSPVHGCLLGKLVATKFKTQASHKLLAFLSIKQGKLWATASSVSISSSSTQLPGNSQQPRLNTDKL